MKLFQNFRFIESFRFIFLGMLFSLLACQEKIQPDVLPKGDDGQVFAIDVGDSEIPYLVINTNGADIPYEPRIPAMMKVYEGKKLKQEQRIGIEFRGKTSFRLSQKKGFNIESIDAGGDGVDVSFLGMPKEEDWRLVGHVVNLNEKYIWDQTLMYNDVGYELSRSIGKYASRSKFVEIEVNGEYLGVYSFMEKLKRDTHRIDVKSLNANSTNLSGGYILTIDKTSVGDAGIGKPLSYFYSNWDDDARYTPEIGFRSQYDIFGNFIDFEPYGPPYHANMYLETYFLYEYPKDRNITPAQKEFIAQYMYDFESALLRDDFTKGERSYADYVSLESFVDYFLINELCRNVDAYRLSTFLQKDRDGKLEMGPVWDMNIGFDQGDRIPMNSWVIRYNNLVSNDPWMIHFWWPRLMEDQEFRTLIKQRWTNFRNGPLSNVAMAQMVDSKADYLQKNGAVLRNYAKWDQGIGVNYAQAVANLKNYLTQRAAWMDGEIMGF
ncbi:CotH kinase family protein [Mongoliitalea daihaiensis]|uniref:CotH kinase family protein n=1 Tax=Mongoliitalea daihaiensis TaxID=2782006 RepID=UPI001F31FC4F|nr:CotH kinase family protein [Mongoliitalea daihaiensis]UJP65418.1 CotH kinase family protein [Mongoliitalea daihaiensis]